MTPGSERATVRRRVLSAPCPISAVSYQRFFQTSGGGVTISGGEPTLFMPFLSSLLKRLKAADLHTLIETNGRFNLADFRKSVLPYTDMIYMDMKIHDRQQHKRFCGVYNDVIMTNFIALHRMSESGTFTILPRTPLIPGITDTEDNIRALAHFYQSSGVTRTAVLKSNPLWSDKHDKLGLDLPRPQPPRKLYDSSRLHELVDIFAEYG